MRGAACRLTTRPPPALLQSVLSAISMGAIVLDPERRIVLWNSWMQQYSGISTEQALGQPFLAVCPELRADGSRWRSLRRSATTSRPAVANLNKAPFPPVCQ
jgi:PAS domain-containing protein